MAKIVIIMSVGSHQNATFGFAKCLRKAGQDVVYAGAKIGIYEENLERNVRKQGFEYEIFDPYNFNSANKNEGLEGNPADDFMNFAQNMFDGLLFEKFVTKVQPDYILLDIHFPIYAIAFYSFKLPIYFLSTELFTDRNSVFPPLTSSLIPTYNDESRKAIEFAWNEDSKNNVLHPGVKFLIEELSKMNEFPLRDYFQEKCIVLFGLKFPELFLWPQEFEFSRNEDPQSNKYYLGSFVDLNREEEAFDWSPINLKKPLVYCAFGTVLDHKNLITFLEKLVSASSLLPECEFIVSVGRLYGKLNEFDLTKTNIHFYRFVPQITVLKKADLMITLGGANSIKEAISLGKPLLCYPFHNDQFGNAARVFYHELGLRGDVFQDSPADIKEKIERILSEELFNNKVAHFQSIFNSYQSENIFDHFSKTLLEM